MPATKLSTYLDARDKNGIRVGDWAEQVKVGVALCKTCVPRSEINFGKGKRELTNHSETLKHIKCINVLIKKRRKVPSLVS